MVEPVQLKSKFFERTFLKHWLAQQKFYELLRWEKMFSHREQAASFCTLCQASHMSHSLRQYCDEDVELQPWGLGSHCLYVQFKHLVDQITIKNEESKQHS